MSFENLLRILPEKKHNTKEQIKKYLYNRNSIFLMLPILLCHLYNNNSVLKRAEKISNSLNIYHIKFFTVTGSDVHMTFGAINLNQMQICFIH